MEWHAVVSQGHSPHMWVEFDVGFYLAPGFSLG